MTNEYLLDVLGDISNRYIAAAAVPGRSGRKRMGKKRVVLIAALVAIFALGLVACAKGWFGLRDFIINRDTDIGEFAEVGQIHTTQNSDVLSLQGYADSPESMAYLEWARFQENYDTDQAIISAIGNSATGFEAEYGCYLVYTQEMADKLEEILAKYDLKKHTRLEILDYEQMKEAVGGPFFDEAEHSHSSGYMYEDGSFGMDMYWTSPEGRVSYQMVRTVRGTFTEVGRYIGDGGTFDQWQYRTGGQNLTLGLSEDCGLVIADLKEAFVVLNILDGSAETWMPEDTTLTRERVERLADSIRWDALAKVRTPDLDAILETYPVEPTIRDGKGAETGAQAGGNTDAEMTAGELLDLFVNDSIGAVRSDDSVFYITDLEMDPEEWDSYSIGERVDLDNDGEEELIMCGPYGGIYLDARDGRVYEFAAGEGTGYMLSYVVYNGATWIMYSNRMHTGYEAYHMEKYEGAGNLVAEMNFHEELVDEDHVEGKERYTLNGEEISYDEYSELCGRVFAAEVDTTK